MGQRWPSKLEAGREIVLIEICFVIVSVIKLIDSPQIVHKGLDEVIIVDEWSVYCRIRLH